VGEGEGEGIPGTNTIPCYSLIVYGFVVDFIIKEEMLILKEMLFIEWYNIFI
jgi:hypothetical protein